MGAASNTGWATECGGQWQAREQICVPKYVLETVLQLSFAVFQSWLSLGIEIVLSLKKSSTICQY